MTVPIRILIADDHFVARMGVRAIIDMQSDMAVVAEACDGREAVTLFGHYLPDIALLDLRMPGMEGVEAACAIRAEHPLAKMVALTTYCGDQDIRGSLAAGMQGYVTKNATISELLEAIRAVHAGQTYVSPTLTAALAAQSPKVDLSAREVDVIKLIAQGLSNKEIATSLNIAEPTARHHVQNVFSKLCVGDRTRAVMEAVQRGIIRP